jgi:hypothetical protein
MSWGPDPEGMHGVYLGKNVASEAGKALKIALTAVTPKVGSASFLQPLHSHCEEPGQKGISCLFYSLYSYYVYIKYVESECQASEPEPALRTEANVQISELAVVLHQGEC